MLVRMDWDPEKKSASDSLRVELAADEQETPPLQESPASAHRVHAARQQGKATPASMVKAGSGRPSPQA